MTTNAVQHMRRRAAARVRRGLYATKAARSLLGKVRPRALVLVYHRIGEPTLDPFGQAVTSTHFAEHLAVIKSRYRVDSVHGLLRSLRERSIEDGTVIITFDDGYADVLGQAVPAAIETSVPLHLFVTVQPVLDGARFWWDRLAEGLLAGKATAQEIRSGEVHIQLDTEERRLAGYRAIHHRLKQLGADERERQLEAILHEVGAQDEADLGRPLTPAELSMFASTEGMEVGTHTLSHPALGALSAAEQRVELAQGRAKLRELTGHSADTIAYPFGKEVDFNAATARIAAELGFVGGFTTLARLVNTSTDPLLVPRLTVHDCAGDAFRRQLEAVFGF